MNNNELFLCSFNALKLIAHNLETKYVAIEANNAVFSRAILKWSLFPTHTHWQCLEGFDCQSRLGVGMRGVWVCDYYRHLVGRGQGCLLTTPMPRTAPATVKESKMSKVLTKCSPKVKSKNSTNKNCCFPLSLMSSPILYSSWNISNPDNAWPTMHFPPATTWFFFAPQLGCYSLSNF